jgi:heme-binding protein
MMTKTSLAIAWFVGPTLLLAGCSSPPHQMAAPQPLHSTAANAVTADPRVGAAFESSCYQCHSTGGHAPWYAAISPTYLAANSARAALNFSDWQSYDAQKRAAELKSIEEAVSGGSMPPWDYTALDHSARLTEEQKQALLRWASPPAEPAH